MLLPGFSDPVGEAQRHFRSILDALARPALAVPFEPGLRPPLPLTAEVAAVALTLADRDAPLWLDDALSASAEVRSFLVFHTGARVVDDPTDAAFALTVDPRRLPALDIFATGSEAYPDRSTTLVAAVDRLADGAAGLLFAGPGIEARRRLVAEPFPADFAERIAANRRRFPLGVDILLTAPGLIAGLPRSVRIVEG